MINLRDLLWRYVYGSDMPDLLTTREILVSLAIFMILLALYRPFRKIIFYTLNHDARRSRFGAALLAVSFSLCWMITSLDLLGYFSVMFSLFFASFLVLVDGVFLLVTRGKA